MAVRSFPAAGPPGAPQEAPEDDYYLLHRESGVLSGLNLTFSGLNWSLSTGDMFVAGMMMLVENGPATGASLPTTGTLPRRDLLVARRTLVASGLSVTVPALKTGVPAAVPLDPGLTQERLGVWEEPLFSWQVPASGGSAVSAVRDRRRRKNNDSAPVYAYLRQAAPQAVGPGGPAALRFQATSYDSHDGHDPASTTPSRWYAPFAGIYEVSGECPIEGSTVTARRWLKLNINGNFADDNNGPFVDAAPGKLVTAVMLPRLVTLAAGQWVELMANQDGPVDVRTACYTDTRSIMQIKSFLIY